MTVPPRAKNEFNTSFVMDCLRHAGILNDDIAREVLAKENLMRARIIKSLGLSPKDAARYEPSPVEIVAAFQIPHPSGRKEILEQDDISELVAHAVGIGYRKIDPLKLNSALAGKTVSQPYAHKHIVLPLEKLPGGELLVAVANPFDSELFENLRRLVGAPIVPVLSAKSDILKAIADIYGFKKTVAQAATDFAGGSGALQNFEQLVSLSGQQSLDASDKPIVQAVDYLLRHAFENRASDIHLEPKRAQTLVRLRIDGVLHPVYSLPLTLHAPLISRIKMLARIDISEKRRPQDGRIKTEREGREVELRVSTLPTAFGEKAVIRIFDPETLVQDIAELGFEPDEKQHFENWIDQPHGLILVTGPTGSGKTTTLYSALKALAGEDVNVTTIEDPIEMVWDAFNQVQVQPKIDLDFATSLRHILRQDPDIIMVGEIRDTETAENAIQAALTGHLVLSTLHTNDAVGAVGRLLDLGIPPFLLSSSLIGVMAQRLVRKICSHCAAETTLTPDELMALKAPLPLMPSGLRLQKGKGCVRCRGTGFFGRSAVFEIFSVNAEIRERINQKGEASLLQALARKAGMRTLRESAVRKLAQGVTSFEEVLRIT